MTDSATSRLKLRQQSQGSNVNTWGDDKLNEVLRVIDRAMHGVQSLAVTGDTTLSWTNYVATNDGQVAWLTLTGSLSSAANLTVPSVEWAWKGIKNSTGQTITVKTAAGAGVAIPTGRQIAVYSDGTDCYFGGGNYLGADTTETNSRDLTDKSYVDTAIATAVIPAAAGTILNSGSDTTAGYLGAKITGSGAVTISTTSPAGNEKTNVAVGVLALATGSTISGTGTTAAVNTRYQVSKTTTYTITLPASPAARDVVWFDLYGLGGVTTFALNSLKYYGATTAPSVSGQGSQVFVYTNAATGWIDL